MVTNVKIFKVLDGDEDRAVPVGNVVPSFIAGTNDRRIDLPNNLSKNTEYSFQFELTDGSTIFSQSWAYDHERKTFALADSIEKKFWKDIRFQIPMAALALIVLFGAGGMCYRRYKKQRDVLL